MVVVREVAVKAVARVAGKVEMMAAAVMGAG